MRLLLAPASMLADEVRGSNEKARSLSASLRQAIRAVVSWLKPTGESVGAPAPVIPSTHPGERTQSKSANSLSLRPPGNARYGADNERPFIREANAGNQRSH